MMTKGLGLLQMIETELRPIAKRKIENKDYEAQIERWNEYQKTLTKIRLAIPSNEAELKHNIKHNYHDWNSDRNLVIWTGVFCMIGLAITQFILIPETYYVREWDYFPDEYGVIYIADEAFRKQVIWNIQGAMIAALGLYSYLWFRILIKPRVVRFSCQPKLHIDDMHFAYQCIEGIKKVTHDPILKLPEIEMAIPRSWIAQQSLLSVMEALRGINLPDDLRQIHLDDTKGDDE